MAAVQPLTANATTATLLDTSQPYAGDSTPIDVQPVLPTSGESPEVDPTDLAVTDIQAGYLTEEGSHTEATP